MGESKVVKRLEPEVIWTGLCLGFTKRVTQDAG